MKNRFRFQTGLAVGLLLIFVVILCSGFLGSADVSFESVIRVLQQKLFQDPTVHPSVGEVSIVWQLRIPRVLLALFIGGGLAISGAGIQAITQNILAEPYILGVSSGALAAVTFSHFMRFPFIHSQAGLAAVAFTGALLAILLVYNIGQGGKGIGGQRLILAGMAVSILLGAFSNFFILTMPDSNIVKGILSWTMGSLAGARWNNIFFPIILTVLFSLFFFVKARDFDTISLGEESALSLGVNVRSLRKRTIICVSMISGVSVACCGVIGLVGFLVPHLIRKTCSAQHNILFPLCYLYGGISLAIMDILARSLLAPMDLPIGIMTALFGAPVFVWVLLRERKR